MDIDILYEDDSIIVIKKPAGIATQSANIAQKDCVSILKTLFRKNNPQKEAYVGLVHRLDQPVSGILVFAKNQGAAAKLSQYIQGEAVCKRYSAVVEGIVPGAEGVELVDYMYKDSRNNTSIVVNDKSTIALPKNANVKKAVLVYSTVEENFEDNTTLLDIVLKTGRFHQIRAQLSHLGHPIAGDRKYGSTVACPDDFAEGGKGAIALKACELNIVHPVTGRKMHFSI